jgi:hypothetical protein
MCAAWLWCGVLVSDTGLFCGASGGGLPAGRSTAGGSSSCASRSISGGCGVSSAVVPQMSVAEDPSWGCASSSAYLTLWLRVVSCTLQEASAALAHP